MFNSQSLRQLWIVVAAAGFLTVAGCSNQGATEATNQPTKAAPAVVKKAPAAKPVAVSAKATQPAQLITVPKDTAITATVGETLASDKNHAGDSFAARLSTPVEVDGKIVLPKGARVTGRVVKVKKHELKVALASIVVRGKSYDLETNSVRPSDKNPPRDTANDGSGDQNTKHKEKKDNGTLPAQTQLVFKLVKPVSVPVKG